MASHWRNPRYDIKAQSGKIFEQGLVLSMALMGLVFLSWKDLDIQAYQPSDGPLSIQVEDIPETRQLVRPPAPQRPQIPIASMEEDIPDDVTIADTELDLSYVPPAPPTPPGAGRSEESPIYMAYQEAPLLIKMVTPEYPALAKKAGVEGEVFLQIVVDEEGQVLDAEVVVARPAGIFEEAAIKAVMQFEYKPALQRDRPVKVRVGQRILFTLNKGNR